MQDATPSGWTGRRVLVTGYSGFVGSWVSAMLLRLGAHVVGYAASADEHARARAGWLGELGAVDVTGDIRDFQALCGVLSGGFDVVIHLAAQPVVSVGYAAPKDTLDVNISGSINVLEAARLFPPRALVHVTSDKCYRNRGWLWPYREVDGLGGGCPYSVSKAAAELVFEAYASLYRMAQRAPAAASVRFGNVIGGGDHAVNRLVPDCLRALSEGGRVLLRRPSAVRPWQHVLDVANGLLLLAGGLHDGTVPAGEVFNFAPPGDGATAGRLAAALVDAWGGGAIDVGPDAGFAEEEVLRLDGRKAAAALGWRHRLDVEPAAEWIVRWQRAVLSGTGPKDATLSQLDEFLEQLRSGSRRQTSAPRSHR